MPKLSRYGCHKQIPSLFFYRNVKQLNSLYYSVKLVCLLGCAVFSVYLRYDFLFVLCVGSVYALQSGLSMAGMLW